MDEEEDLSQLEEEEREREAVRKVREEQRRLKQTLEDKDKQEDMQSIGSKLFDAMQKGVTKYFDGVTNPATARVDASIFLGVTTLLGHQAKSIGQNNIPVSSTLLSRQLLAKFPVQAASGSNSSGPLGPQIDFAKLGLECRVFFPALPVFDCMLGAVEISIAAKKQRTVAASATQNKKRAEVVHHQVETLGELKSTTKKARTSVEDGEDGEDSEEESQTAAGESQKQQEEEANQFKLHEDLQKQLISTLRQRAKERQDMFATVVNPKSFTQTVENMFALSFLVKDGKSSIQLDPEAHNAIVLPVKGKTKDPKLGEKTFVLAFSYEDWQRLADKLEEEEVLLPNRDSAIYEDCDARGGERETSE